MGTPFSNMGGYVGDLKVYISTAWLIHLQKRLRDECDQFPSGPILMV